MLEVFKDINNIKVGGVGVNQHTKELRGSVEPHSKKKLEERKNEVAKAVGAKLNNSMLIPLNFHPLGCWL